MTAEDFASLTSSSSDDSGCVSALISVDACWTAGLEAGPRPKMNRVDLGGAAAVVLSEGDELDIITLANLSLRPDEGLAALLLPL